MKWLKRFVQACQLKWRELGMAPKWAGPIPRPSEEDDAKEE